MEKIKSESEKRLIVEGQVNGKKAYFLIDTGASVGIIDHDQRVELVCQIGGGAEGGKRGGSSFFPFPLPDGVKVGIAYQMNFFHDDSPFRIISL